MEFNSTENLTNISSSYQEEKLYQLGLTMIPGIGDVLIKQLVSYLGSAKGVFSSKKPKILKVPGIGEKTAESILKAEVLLKAEAELNLIHKAGARILFYTDKAFPEKLKQIPDSPVVLYYKGSVDLNFPKIISIVGTRNSTDYGKDFVDSFISDIKSHPILVVSGLAYGIDVAVHKACIENGIPTIGVMGTGIDLIYPALNKNIALQMINNGGVLTEFPLGTKPDKQNFPARNRIVAGIADATIIVEAAKKGGALITAEIANSYNKDVFAVPGNIHNKYSEGCNDLIKENKAQLITSAKDFMEAMTWDSLVSPSKSNLSDISGLEPEERIIYTLLKQNNELHIDDIAWKSQLPINKVASLLLSLEFQGLVKTSPGKKFKLK